MPQAASPNVASAPRFDSLPFQAEQTSSRTASAILLLLLVPVLATMIVPVGLLVVFAANEVREAIIHKPLPAAALGVGLLTWTALFLVPAKRLIQRFGRRRCATIARERVTVADNSLFSVKHWSAPLAEFSGVARHVRATLSGTRHELVLVHPARNRSVLLHSADAIAQSTVDRAAALFRLQQIHDSHSIALRRLERIIRAPEAVAQAQAA
jgi:hypothetical protein